VCHTTDHTYMPRPWCVRIGVGMGGLHHGGDGCQCRSYHSRVVNWCKGDCIGKLFRSGRDRWILGGSEL
jgi:hypothetical protein